MKFSIYYYSRQYIVILFVWCIPKRERRPVCRLIGITAVNSVTHLPSTALLLFGVRKNFYAFDCDSVFGPAAFRSIPVRLGLFDVEIYQKIIELLRAHFLLWRFFRDRGCSRSCAVLFISGNRPASVASRCGCSRRSLLFFHVKPRLDALGAFGLGTAGACFPCLVRTPNVDAQDLVDHPQHCLQRAVGIVAPAFVALSFFNKTMRAIKFECSRIGSQDRFQFVPGVLCDDDVAFCCQTSLHPFRNPGWRKLESRRSGRRVGRRAAAALGCLRLGRAGIRRNNHGIGAAAVAIARPGKRTVHGIVHRHVGLDVQDGRPVDEIQSADVERHLVGPVDLDPVELAQGDANGVVPVGRPGGIDPDLFPAQGGGSDLRLEAPLLLGGLGIEVEVKEDPDI
mmetsp:Transcript_10924/g.24817  ORF Transcript_10924/g.24817 Transcript_10924/m.24817 type:complete len:396 (+) Transcript_10924:1833-3020(+)